MKKICFILLLISLQSCKVLVKQSLCDRLYPTYDSTRVEYKDSIVRITDTVYVPYQEITFDTSGIVPTNIIFHKDFGKGKLSGFVDIRNGRITAGCKEDSLMILLNKERNFRIKETFNSKKELVYRDKPKNGWMHFCEWFAIIVLIAATSYVGIKLFR